MKPKTKRFLKIGLPIIGTSIFVGLTIGISGVLINTATISVAGSSAVLPLMNSISNAYKGADIVTTAGGSGVGINYVLQGLKEIGMASKNPNTSINKHKNPNIDFNLPEFKEWKEKEIKTITIAWDGIGIIYKPSNFDDELVLNRESLAKIYTAFSGVKEITMGDILGNEDKTKVIPFARNGGSSTSGTADAFLKDSGINYKESQYWTDLGEDKEKVLDALEHGSYGINVVQTAEANSQAWDRVKTGGVGSIIYLSSGFIFNNLKEIENAGFKVATYSDKKIKLTKETLTNGYNWYRPFNLLFSLKHVKNNKTIQNTINWILFNDKAKEIINKDYVALTEEQIKTMYTNNTIQNDNFFENSSDIDIGYCGAYVNRELI